MISIIVPSQTLTVTYLYLVDMNYQTRF